MVSWCTGALTCSFMLSSGFSAAYAGHRAFAFARLEILLLASFQTGILFESQSGSTGVFTAMSMVSAKENPKRPQFLSQTIKMMAVSSPPALLRRSNVYRPGSRKQPDILRSLWWFFLYALSATSIFIHDCCSTAIAASLIVNFVEANSSFLL